MEEIGGTVIAETPDGLTLRANLRSTLLGALSYYLLIGVPLFLARFFLIGIRSPYGHNLLLIVVAPVVGLIAFGYLLSRPPLIVRRDGRVDEGRTRTDKIGDRRVVVREKGNYLYLGLEPSLRSMLALERTSCSSIAPRLSASPSGSMSS